MLVMVRRVGSDAGPDITLIESLAAKAPDCAVYAAGGIRSIEDLERVAAAGAAGALAAYAGLPNPFMFGPLLAAIALTSNEIQLSSIPTWITNAGQMLLGCALASRFEREFLKGLGRYAGAVLADDGPEPFRERADERVGADG